MSLTLARPGWDTRLARPLLLQDGTVIKSLADARAYVFGLNEGVQSRSSWQCAAGRLILAAEGVASIKEATTQMELALLIEGKLKLAQ